MGRFPKWPGVLTVMVCFCVSLHVPSFADPGEDEEQPAVGPCSTCGSEETNGGDPDDYDRFGGIDVVAGGPTSIPAAWVWELIQIVWPR
jgi:hypothetical protein